MRAAKDRSAKLPRGPHPFEISILSAEGVPASSLGTVLSGRNLTRPLWSGLVLPALAEYLSTAGQRRLNSQDVVGISVGGVEVTETSSKISSFVTAGEPTRVEIRLPPGLASPAMGGSSPTASTGPGASASKAAQVAFQIDILDHDGELVSGMACALDKRWLSRPLMHCLLAPAMKSYYLDHPSAPRLALETLAFAVDGVATNGQAPAASFVKGASTPVHVSFTLPRPPGEEESEEADEEADEAAEAAKAAAAKPSAKKAKGGRLSDRLSRRGKKPTKDKAFAGPQAFTVDIQTVDGETISSMGTVLRHHHLAQPLAKALIAPALGQYDKESGRKTDPASAIVYVRGVRVDPLDTVASYGGLALVPGVRVGVVILLPAGSPSAFKPRQMTKAEHSAVFHVDMLTSSGSSYEFEAKLTPKWLARPLVHSLVEPALKNVKLHGIDPERVAVFVEGEAVERTRAGSEFALTPGLPVRVVLQLPDEVSPADVQIAVRRSLLARAASVATLQGLRRSRAERASGEGKEGKAKGPPTAKFMVSMHGGLKWEMNTELNAKWLSKPLRDALIAPALKTYFKLDIGSSKVAVDDVRVEVDGEEVDAKAVLAASFIGPDGWSKGKAPGLPVQVDLFLPATTSTYELTRISKAK